ncbi:MAG: hypothetical protein RLY86_4188 [Pseudomonadota bacterium]|jgi:5-formyltetrahydrofolate cyclo-ligase
MMRPANDAGPAVHDPVAAAKQAARAAAKAARAAIPADAAAAHAAAVVDPFLAAFPDLAPGTVVAGYWPLAGELDVRPLLRALAGRGVHTGLPVVAGRGWPLTFRLWREGHPLVPGPFRVMEPMRDAPVVRPDIVLVPLLAYDPRGMRLGYGAGFYDRTLAALREEGPVMAVGVAHAAQGVAQVPTDPYDQKLDLLLTERGLTRFP